MPVWCHAGRRCGRGDWRGHEAHVSAEQPAAPADARISQADEHEDGQAGPAPPPRQGPQAPFRVVGNCRSLRGVIAAAGRRGSESFPARPDSTTQRVSRRAAAGRADPGPLADPVRPAERPRPEQAGDHRHPPPGRSGSPEPGEAPDARALQARQGKARIRSGRAAAAGIFRRSIQHAGVRLPCHAPAAWAVPPSAPARAGTGPLPRPRACCWARLGPIR